MNEVAFSYRGYELDPSGLLTCRYSLGDRRFVERADFGPGAWTGAPAREAARLVYLLAGVSYYKTAAPPVVRVDVGLRPAELAMLEAFYRRGLAEFAYRNRLDLAQVRIEAAVEDRAPADFVPPADRPLVLFGGGKDSIVTVEEVKARRPNAALFVVSPHTAPFEAIERVVPITGLPVVRVTRRIDPQLLEPPARTGFLQGHVPVTGIIAALAVLAATGAGHDAVVLSNERSASDPNLVVDGAAVNHQYSKSEDFEAAFAEVVAGALGPGLRVFSLLRPYAELWVAERFARLDRYHRAFRSCNRAFPIDPAKRLDRWCGECDKCCFVDLILAPFLPRSELDAIFDGREPLASPELLGRFEVFVGLSPDPKPFECVGEIEESRAAAVLATRRADRASSPILSNLAVRLPPLLPETVAGLLAPKSPHRIPDEFAPEDLLV